MKKFFIIELACLVVVIIFICAEVESKKHRKHSSRRHRWKAPGKGAENGVLEIQELLPTQRRPHNKNKGLRYGGEGDSESQEPNIQKTYLAESKNDTIYENFQEEHSKPLINPQQPQNITNNTSKVENDGTPVPKNHKELNEKGQNNGNPAPKNHKELNEKVQNDGNHVPKNHKELNEKGQNDGNPAPKNHKELNEKVQNDGNHVPKNNEELNESAGVKAFKDIISQHSCEGTSVYKQFLIYYKKAVSTVSSDSTQNRSQVDFHDYSWMKQIAEAEKEFIDNGSCPVLKCDKKGTSTIRDKTLPVGVGENKEKKDEGPLKSAPLLNENNAEKDDPTLVKPAKDNVKTPVLNEKNRKDEGGLADRALVKATTDNITAPSTVEKNTRKDDGGLVDGGLLGGALGKPTKDNLKEPSVVEKNGTNEGGLVDGGLLDGALGKPTKDNVKDPSLVDKNRKKDDGGLVNGGLLDGTLGKPTKDNLKEPSVVVKNRTNEGGLIDGGLLDGALGKPTKDNVKTSLLNEKNAKKDDGGLLEGAIGQSTKDNVKAPSLVEKNTRKEDGGLVNGGLVNGGLLDGALGKPTKDNSKAALLSENDTKKTGLGLVKPTPENVKALPVTEETKPKKETNLLSSLGLARSNQKSPGRSNQRSLGGEDSFEQGMKDDEMELDSEEVTTESHKTVIKNLTTPSANTSVTTLPSQSETSQNLTKSENVSYPELKNLPEKYANNSGKTTINLGKSEENKDKTVRGEAFVNSSVLGLSDLLAKRVESKKDTTTQSPRLNVTVPFQENAKPAEHLSGKSDPQPQTNASVKTYPELHQAPETVSNNTLRNHTKDEENINKKYSNESIVNPNVLVQSQNESKTQQPGPNIKESLQETTKSLTQLPVIAATQANPAAGFPTDGSTELKKFPTNDSQNLRNSQQLKLVTELPQETLKPLDPLSVITSRQINTTPKAENQSELNKNSTSDMQGTSSPPVKQVFSDPQMNSTAKVPDTHSPDIKKSPTIDLQDLTRSQHPKLESSQDVSKPIELLPVLTRPQPNPTAATDPNSESNRVTKNDLHDLTSSQQLKLDTEPKKESTKTLESLPVIFGTQSNPTILKLTNPDSESKTAVKNEYHDLTKPRPLKPEFSEETPNSLHPPPMLPDTQIHPTATTDPNPESQKVPKMESHDSNNFSLPKQEYSQQTAKSSEPLQVVREPQTVIAVAGPNSESRIVSKTELQDSTNFSLPKQEYSQQTAKNSEPLPVKRGPQTVIAVAGPNSESMKVSKIELQDSADLSLPEQEYSQQSEKSPASLPGIREPQANPAEKTPTDPYSNSKKSDKNNLLELTNFPPPEPESRKESVKILEPLGLPVLAGPHTNPTSAAETDHNSESKKVPKNEDQAVIESPHPKLESSREGIKTAELLPVITEAHPNPTAISPDELSPEKKKAQSNNLRDLTGSLPLDLGLAPQVEKTPTEKPIGRTEPEPNQHIKQAIQDSEESQSSVKAPADSQEDFRPPKPTEPEYVDVPVTQASNNFLGFLLS